MCEIRVGIVAEGPTDQLLIRGIINAEFPDISFVFTNISPTEDELLSGIKPERFGWGGVSEELVYELYWLNTGEIETV